MVINIIFQNNIELLNLIKIGVLTKYGVYYKYWQISTFK